MKCEAANCTGGNWAGRPSGRVCTTREQSGDLAGRGQRGRGDGHEQEFGRRADLLESLSRRLGPRSAPPPRHVTCTGTGWGVEGKGTELQKAGVAEPPRPPTTYVTLNPCWLGAGEESQVLFLEQIAGCTVLGLIRPRRVKRGCHICYQVLHCQRLRSSPGWPPQHGPWRSPHSSGVAVL